MFSSLAAPIKELRITSKKRTRADGIVLHTTGRGPFEKAGGNSDKALEIATKYYSGQGNAFPIYLIGHDGTIIQIASEIELNWHAAWDKEQVGEYQKWDRNVSIPQKYFWWILRWCDEPPRNFRSPLALLEEVTDNRSWGPDDNIRESPNDDYIGIEILWHPEGARKEQYTSCARLCTDIADRHQFPIDFPLPSPRLLGHEDLCPITRTMNSGKPWDPGIQLDWKKFEQKMEELTPSSGILDKASIEKIINPWSH